jgi:hypothetical protein
MFIPFTQDIMPVMPGPTRQEAQNSHASLGIFPAPGRRQTGPFGPPPGEKARPAGIIIGLRRGGPEFFSRLLPSR